MTEDLKNSLSHDLFIYSPFWKSRLETLAHPVAMRMAQDLDATGPLGIGDGNQAFWKGFKHHYGLKDSNIDFLLRVKNQHPQKIILVQIGEFYETWGLDSVFLVEHCGINRMGRKGPRAGMPIANIQSVLDDLTDAGFCVVVCEQADDIHKKGRKIRFISEIITPSSPTYTYGLAMSHKANICFPETPPEFGLAQNSKGVTVVEVNPDLRTTLVLEGLTIEAAIIRLNKYSGRMNRVFLHDELSSDLVQAANLKFQNLVRISGYASRHFATRVEEMIKIDLGLDAKVKFLKTKQVRLQDCPNPLYQQTAQQIGILPKRGIVDLIALMLPKGSPATCKYIVRNILLNPPPPHYANSLRQAIIALQTQEQQLPTLIVSNPARYIKTLNKHEAHPEILKDLFCLAQIFLTCSNQLSPQFIDHILEVVSYISAIKAEKDVIGDVSNQIIEALSPILPMDDDEVHVPQHDLIPTTLFERIEEEFRNRVARNATPEIAKLYDKNQQAALKYEALICEKLIPIVEAGVDKNAKRARKPALTYDIHNHAIWMLGSVSAKVIEQHHLIHPLDRYGKEVKDRWSVQEVEDALQAYKESATAAYDAIKNLLKKLSKELAVYCLPIIHLATFSNVVKTLYLHVKECQPRHWTTNFIVDETQACRMDLEGFFPYWMKLGQGVTNNLQCDGTCLLTGHNMSGKSTLIRSLATTTLLAASGFMFPAKRVSLAQEIDGWFIRTGAQDDPQAGLSAFAVEMTDIKVALRDATSKSFLLIDELGKGTESKAGHAIAASVLEYLISKKIRAIFATHWHEIFANPEVNLHEATLIKMQCDGDVATYKAVAGVDLNSSAFYTARKVGVKEDIIKRAQKIADGYDAFALAQISRNDNSLILRDVFDEDSADLSHHDDNTIKQILSLAAGKTVAQVRKLKHNEIPSLKDIGYSVVYILRTANHFFYVGETDNFLHRVKAHRVRLNDDTCEFFYIAVKEGKSQARKIEQQLIVQLKEQGFAMLSIGDATNLNFGAV